MLGIIGGSGLYELNGLVVSDKKEIDTPFGSASGPITFGDIEGRKIAFMPRHGNPHQIAPHLINYRANLHALKQVGVERIIAVNAVGAIHPQFSPKTLSIPDQIIDYTYGRAHTIYDGDFVEVVDHIDFTFPYSQVLRGSLVEAAKALSLDCLEQGVYGATQGPRLETAQEIQRCKNDGCDMVGMTGMPEAALARELSVEYACIAISVNWAAGLTDDLITMDDIREALSGGIASVNALIRQYLVGFEAV